MFGVKITTRTTFDIKPIERATKILCRQHVETVMNLTSKYAQENVAPGRGPGPHPHVPKGNWPDWVDTGNLQLAIDIIQHPRWRGQFISGSIGTYSQYGYDLEQGWTGPSGKIYRYPWLRPAFDRAVSEAMSMLYAQRLNLPETIGHAMPGSELE